MPRRPGAGRIRRGRARLLVTVFVAFSLVLVVELVILGTAGRDLRPSARTNAQTAPMRPVPDESGTEDVPEPRVDPGTVLSDRTFIFYYQVCTTRLCSLSLFWLTCCAVVRNARFRRSGPALEPPRAQPRRLDGRSVRPPELSRLFLSVLYLIMLHYLYLVGTTQRAATWARILCR
jgi:hypothetical protein